MRKRSKLDYSGYFSILPEILVIVLKSFHNSEDSLFVSLVCKLWNSLIRNDRPISLVRATLHYASCGTPSALQFVRKTTKNDSNFFSTHFFACASNTCLDWSLKVLPHQYRSNAISGAAAGGHLEFLKHLHQQERFPSWNLFSSTAAEHGHIHILEWAINNGYHVGTATCASAALGGQLETLKWLRNKQCYWDENTCINAAKAGHLKILEWATANGCEITDDVIEAAGNGSLKTLKWMVRNGYQLNIGTLNAALRNGKQEIVQWLLKKGWIIDDDFY